MQRTKIGDSILSTSLADDADPSDTDDGLLAVLSPEDANLATESEDVDAFESLREDLSPGESQRVLDTMRPLSKEEEQILDDMPEIEQGSVVDPDEVREAYDEEAIEFPGEWTTDSRLCLLAAAPRPVTIMAAIIDAEAHK